MFRTISTLAALSLCALAAPAAAQMGPPPGPPPHEWGGRHMGPPSPEMEKAMAEHRAQRAKDMHAVLRLRPDQEGAWQAYQAAMTPPPRPPEGGPPKGPPPATTPERLDMMDKRMARMEAHRAKMEAATRAFYAALSPDQQQAFDALERMRGPHGGGGPRMMIRMRGMPPR